MNITIQTRPNWLLEAVELTYSYIHDRPIEELVGNSPWCIPLEEVRRIRDAACAGLDPWNPMLRFFFDGVLFDNNPKRELFIASHMVYSTMLDFRPTVEEQVEAMLEFWRSLTPPWMIGEADAICIAIGSAADDNKTSFFEDVARLPVPASFQAKFIEVTYNFERYLLQLVDLLRPVTDALPSLLAPWIERTAPLRAQWLDMFRGPNGNRFFTERQPINGFHCRQIVAALRYFPASGGYARVQGPEGYACLILGLGMSTEHKAPPPPEAFSELETSAMRILLNANRVAMLQSMRKAPKSGQDLMNELDLPSGPVFRDLNNMARVGLINREVGEGKNIYRTNPAAIRRFAQRIVQVLASEED